MRSSRVLMVDLKSLSAMTFSSLAEAFAPMYIYIYI